MSTVFFIGGFVMGVGAGVFLMSLFVMAGRADQARERIDVRFADDEEWAQ